MCFNQKIKIGYIFTLLFLLPVYLFAQSNEVDAYRAAKNFTDKPLKIEAFKKFLSAYPNSMYAPNALFEIFTVYLEINKIDSALIYANLTVESFPVQIRMNVYNEISFSLAQKKIGLDTAAAYIQRAVSDAKAKNVSKISMYLDTQALVLYDLGKVDSALELEEEAIPGNEDDESYLTNLATYQAAAGKKLEAIKTAAQAILYGNTDDALTNFNLWIKDVKPLNEKEQDKLRKSIVDSTINTFLINSKDADKHQTYSNAASFLAYMGSNLDLAEKWAKESLQSLEENSPVEVKITFTKNYALVLAAKGKYTEAIKTFGSVEFLTDPWDSDFWYSLAKTYEKMNEDKKAVDTYVMGSVAYPQPKLTKAFNVLAVKVGLNEDQIQSLIEKKRDELSTFDPGHYKDNKQTGNVVLAELFTGAECGPCAGADYAFDALSEFFPRSALVILEYHVHIPAPDPMTNPDSFNRYKFYGGDFGTPTVIIEGKEKITGGGQKYLANNRFNIYKFALEKYLSKKSSLTLSGSVIPKIDSLIVNLLVKKGKNFDKDASLQIALVEKSIQYSGSNGVNKHLFVVRNLIRVPSGKSGFELLKSSDKTNEQISAVFNLNEIEQNLSAYLDDPTKDPSWRQGLSFPGWRQRMDKLNKNNLAVVAWIQDMQTKEVLQSIFLNVPPVSSNVGIK